MMSCKHKWLYAGFFKTSRTKFVQHRCPKCGTKRTKYVPIGKEPNKILYSYIHEESGYLRYSQRWVQVKA